jgi:hypothetical protein
MRDQKVSPGQAGAGQVGVAKPGRVATPHEHSGAASVPTHYTTPQDTSQDFSPSPAVLPANVRSLLDLATQALARADRARLLAECCQVAGDPAGAARWGERQSRHLAILRAALGGVS